MPDEAPAADTARAEAVAPYVPRRHATSSFVDVRGLRHHVLTWGADVPVTPERPLVLMQHGWMDVAASFQFVVDALRAERRVAAFDWRGFGLTATPAGETYWIPDYTADLDAMVDALAPGAAIDLLGHSMGGNVAMIYAGLRPQRVRRLVNLEGFGMPRTRPEMVVKRYVAWLDELKQPQGLASYASADHVAARLRKNNPLLRADRAAWLARQWARPQGGAPDARWALLADPIHKRGTPLLHHVDETLEIWKRIEAPVLWAEGNLTETSRWWGTRYTKEEFHQRLAVVPRVEKHVLAPAGHMLHHDQPEALAQRLEAFLDAP